jgi:hypothetical protein
VPVAALARRRLLVELALEEVGGGAVARVVGRRVEEEQGAAGLDVVEVVVLDPVRM